MGARLGYLEDEDALEGDLALHVALPQRLHLHRHRHQTEGKQENDKER